MVEGPALTETENMDQDGGKTKSTAAEKSSQIFLIGVCLLTFVSISLTIGFIVRTEMKLKHIEAVLLSNGEPLAPPKEKADNSNGRCICKLLDIKGHFKWSKPFYFYRCFSFDFDFAQVFFELLLE